MASLDRRKQEQNDQRNKINELLYSYINSCHSLHYLKLNMISGIYNRNINTHCQLFVELLFSWLSKTILHTVLYTVLRTMAEKAWKINLK